MLQLTLEQGESVMVGENIKIYYDRLKSNKQLVLVFDAPKEVKIVRENLILDQLAAKAEAGDTKAQQRLDKLARDKADREYQSQLRRIGREERRRARREENKASVI